MERYLSQPSTRNAACNAVGVLLVGFGLVSPENADALADIVLFLGTAIISATTAYDAVRDEDAQTLERVREHRISCADHEQRKN